MKEHKVKVLDDKDLEFAETIRSLGLPRNVAYTLTFLANVDEATSRDIEMGTELRQPEVSIAMKELRGNNWVSVREYNREGKGRPVKIYKLGVPIDDIIEHLRQAKEAETRQAMDNIRRLKELSKQLT